MTTGLQITIFVYMYVYLQLLVSEKLLMVQWSRFWQLSRVPVPKDTISYKNLKLVLKGCIYPNIFAILF